MSNLLIDLSKKLEEAGEQHAARTASKMNTITNAAGPEVDRVADSLAELAVRGLADEETRAAMKQFAKVIIGTIIVTALA
jgi:hypothetical protein